MFSYCFTILLVWQNFRILLISQNLVVRRIRTPVQANEIGTKIVFLVIFVMFIASCQQKIQSNCIMDFTILFGDVSEQVRGTTRCVSLHAT